MLKDTKSLGNNKAPACESRGFVLKKKKVRILTHLLSISNKNNCKIIQLIQLSVLQLQELQQQQEQQLQHSS